MVTQQQLDAISADVHKYMPHCDTVVALLDKIRELQSKVDLLQWELECERRKVLRLEFPTAHQ